MIVFMLYHIVTDTSGNDCEKLIGVYSSGENAKAAISRLRGFPGFRENPESFQIFEHLIDRDGWTEGFISTEEALRP